MNNHFRIIYKNTEILVEGGETGSYVLKYPDGKSLMIDKQEKKWVLKDGYGHYWTDEDIQAIGKVLNENDNKA